MLDVTYAPGVIPQAPAVLVYFRHLSPSFARGIGVVQADLKADQSDQGGCCQSSLGTTTLRIWGILCTLYRDLGRTLLYSNHDSSGALS